MKSSFLTVFLIIGFSVMGFAGGVIMSPGIFGDKKLVTRMSHDELKASSDWKLGNGEPPVSSVVASELAMKSLKETFPDFPDAIVREISLVSSKSGCYYRVSIIQDVADEEVKDNGGHMKVSQTNFYVLLNSTVIAPKERD